MLCPYQASRHLSTVLRRQLQRHLKEIQEHGGAGLRVPLTHADVPPVSKELGTITKMGVS